MNIKIRLAQPSDYMAIGNLIKNELSYADLNLDKAIERLKFMENDNNYCTFVALDTNMVVGFIGLMKGVGYEVDGMYAKITALAVNENYQRKGVGTQLNNQVEKWASENEITKIGLNSGIQRKEAHKFYEKQGYHLKSYSFSKTLERK